jgi:uncharacterized RDD family membrane protein YckC
LVNGVWSAIVLSAVAFGLVYPAIVTRLTLGLVSPYKKADVNRRLIAVGVDSSFVAVAAYFYWNSGFWPYLAPGVAYLVFRDGIHGQSIGKFLMGLMVISLETGRPATLSSSVRRNLLFLIPGANVVALILEVRTLIGDPQGQRLGDRLAQTQVIEGFGAKDLVRSFQQWLLGLGPEFGRRRARSVIN